MAIIRKIADFFLSTYLFIASASACLVLSTYILTSQAIHLNAMVWFSFFCTLLIYNFHRVSTLLVRISLSPKIILEQFEHISLLTKVMVAVAAVGILFSGSFLHAKTLLFFFALGAITFAYSVPVIKVKGTKKRLREIVIIKITTLAFTWSLTTVTLPMLETGVTILSMSSALIFTERFLFMYAICIPFEIRDIVQEKKRGNMTLPQLIGVNTSKTLGVIMLVAFILMVAFQFGKISFWTEVMPLSLSALAAALLLIFSDEKRNTYYFRIFVDGTMQLQFLLLILFRLSV
jgi:hypothetical protein